MFYFCPHVQCEFNWEGIILFSGTNVSLTGEVLFCLRYYVSLTGEVILSQVLCEFSWGGCTYPLRRYSSSNFNLNWTTAKTGVIKDLLASTINSNFFIGLDNLHHLTNQAGYNNHVFISYNSWQSQGSAFYDYFKIGNESTSYAITYKTFYPGSNPGDNGFNAPSPIVFCTQDHDTNACAQQMGSPGWYGSNCNGYSMFSSSFKWPVNGADKNLDMLVFNLVRLTPFLDE